MAVNQLERKHKIFIALALAAFALFFFTLFDFLPSPVPAAPAAVSPDRYYFKERASTSDPFLTVKPNLGNMLAGPIISAADPSLGKADAPITVTYFADVTCRYCRQSEAVVREMVKKYPDQVRLLWKDYPETDPNSLSFQAALAGRCAAYQGKFWAYHDALSAAVPTESAELLTAAQKLGLEEASFKTCLNGEGAFGLVEENIAEAEALSLPGVPFAYVNDQELFDTIDAPSLERLIAAELKKAE